MMSFGQEPKRDVRSLNKDIKPIDHFITCKDCGYKFEDSLFITNCPICSKDILEDEK